MATTPSITELMRQMQQNLDSINYHLARIEDTKAHDDEIERLEVERQKRADALSLQIAQDFKELENKKRELGRPAEEKRRKEAVERADRRKREERELMLQRRKEDAEIVARRMREDAVRKARMKHEDEELETKALEEEEHIKTLLAGEEERGEREAAEKENSLYEDFEAKMIQLEDEMEKKVVESTKILAELDEKRKVCLPLISPPDTIEVTFYNRLSAHKSMLP
jgi:isochorismate synthase EntC